MTFISIFFMCILIYVYVTSLLRFFGKKEFSQLNVYDFVVFLILAELMTLSISDDSVTFFHSVVATIALILVDRFVSFITLKNKRIRDNLEGRPSYIIFKGEINQQRMKELRYSIDDLMTQLRIAGIISVSQVEFALLETNGNLSVIEKNNCFVEIPDPVINDGCIDNYNLELLGYDSDWLINQLKIHHCTYDEVFYCMIENGSLFIIKKQL